MNAGSLRITPLPPSPEPQQQRITKSGIIIPESYKDSSSIKEKEGSWWHVILFILVFVGLIWLGVKCDS
jgi:hypothetical protein